MPLIYDQRDLYEPRGRLEPRLLRLLAPADGFSQVFLIAVGITAPAPRRRGSGAEGGGALGCGALSRGRAGLHRFGRARDAARQRGLPADDGGPESARAGPAGRPQKASTRFVPKRQQGPRLRLT